MASANLAALVDRVNAVTALEAHLAQASLQYKLLRTTQSNMSTIDENDELQMHAAWANLESAEIALTSSTLTRPTAAEWAAALPSIEVRSDGYCAASSDATNTVRMASMTYGACPVCREAFQAPMATPCAHVMCTNCVLKWVATKNHRTCPYCVQAVEPQDLKKLQIE